MRKWVYQVPKMCQTLGFEMGIRFMNIWSYKWLKFIHSHIVTKWWSLFVYSTNIYWMSTFV